MKKVYSKLIIAILIVFGITIVISCNKKKESQNFNEDLIPKRLSFQKIDLNTISTKGTIVIVEWDEWGRAKKNCGGWGLCNAVWFPQPTDSEKSDSTISNFSTLLKLDSITGNYYIDIILSAPVPDDVPIELFPLRIDENFTFNVEEAIGKNLQFNEGEYPFDESLGEFGGFRIYLH